MDTIPVILRLDRDLGQQNEEGRSALDAISNLFPPPSVGLSLRHGRYRRLRRSPPPRLRVYPTLGLAYGRVPSDNLDALLQTPHVRAAVPVDATPVLVRPVAILRYAKPEAAGNSWGARMLGVAPDPDAVEPTEDDRPLWHRGLDGTGVLIGHLDTGVDGGHQMLRGRVADYALFDEEGQRIVGAEPADGDADGHGTHTAGILVGATRSGGAAGIAPGASLVTARVIEGGDVVARILAGLEWMAASGVRVVNLSLGLPGYRAAFEVLLEALDGRGVLCVCAVGNEGAGQSRSPGNYRKVLSVGAVDRTGQVADFSGSATIRHAPPPYDVPDLVAPGVRIVSAVPNGGYVEMSGTSMAAPHVAGLAALLCEATGGRATVADLRDAILGACALPRGETAARAGSGIPDARRAFARLASRGLVLRRFL